MFFLNRLQHLGMHHLGPFLIALAWPGETIDRGMPEAGRRLVRGHWIQRVLRVVQNPVIAGLLFVGLVWFWLQPDVHFQAMISPVLYTTMNLSMVIDGLLFWCFVLDPRPAPPARHSYAVRLITCILVVFPQLFLGARLTFGVTPLYSYYDLCGRLFPSVSALLDQHLGGLVVWIPSSMMSSIAFMLMLNNIRIQEDRQWAETAKMISRSPRSPRFVQKLDGTVKHDRRRSRQPAACIARLEQARAMVAPVRLDPAPRSC